MTQNEYEMEQDWIASQERHHDYICEAVLGAMFREDNIDLIEKGFDLVCMIENGEMLAGECIMATSVRDAAHGFAKAYQAQNKCNLVVIYTDGPRAADWLVVDQSVFS